MRTAIRIVQVLVGLLFIVSGLVKANDPIGLAYKMEEFFELWSAGLSPQSFGGTFLKTLHTSSLSLSIGIITLEIVAGWALLLAWQKRVVLWALLLLIVFFTFLTGYAYLSGKFTNCGCFGDCLPIMPITSFLKDIALLFMIVFLIIGNRFIAPLISNRKGLLFLLVGTALTLALQLYVLNNLPLVDCLPFKKGASIPQQMSPPAGSVPDSFAIRFIYEKGGKQFEFAPESLPADFNTYKFIDRKQTLVRKGNADIPIKGFTLKSSGSGDSTEIILAHPKTILIFSMEVNPDVVANLRTLAANASAADVPVYFVSSSTEGAEKALASAGIQTIAALATDFTIVRTVARTSPTLLFLQKGKVTEKFSKREIDKAAEKVKTF